MNNIYDFALQFEKDSESLYRELINNTNSEGIKNILNMLADEEVKHYEIISNLKNNIKEIFNENAEVLNNSKNIIQQMKEKNEKVEIDESQIKIYEKARSLETDSKKFYEEKSREVQSENQKEILLKLAYEEEKHFIILDNLLTHVSRPQTWVEDAEFTTREEY